MIDMSKEPIERLLALAVKGDNAAIVTLEERDLVPPVRLTAEERSELFLGVTNRNTIIGAGARLDDGDTK